MLSLAQIISHLSAWMLSTGPAGQLQSVAAPATQQVMPPPAGRAGLDVDRSVGQGAHDIAGKGEGEKILQGLPWRQSLVSGLVRQSSPILGCCPCESPGAGSLAAGTVLTAALWVPGGLGNRWVAQHCAGAAASCRNVLFLRLFSPFSP